MADQQTALPPALKLAQYHLKGKLAHFITDRRERGLSWDRVARDLWEATAGEVDVTGPTVASWAARLGIEDAA